MARDQADAAEYPPELSRLPPGRHGLPRDFVVHNQRERLIAGLAEAVAEKGYGGTTIADITRHAAVSRRTFYEHFDGKDECFVAAFDTVTEQLKARQSDPKPLIALIYASLSFVLGLYLKETVHLERAIAWDPEFPVYRLELARLQVGSTDPAVVDAGAAAMLALRHTAVVSQVQEGLENLLLSNRLSADSAVLDAVRRAVLGMRATKGSLNDLEPIGYGID